MYKFQVIYVVFAAIFALGNPATSQTVSGNALHSFCEDTDSDAFQGMCNGYVLGTLEGMKFGAFNTLVYFDGDDANLEEVNALVNIVLGVCIPQEVDYVQIVDIITKHLTNHPETRHNSARSEIWTALRNVFPCSSIAE
jgi:hypothetical protein